MKKIIAIFFLSVIIFTSCEKDDFCTQNPITPKLIIKFYDDLDRETVKQVNRFSIIPEGKTDSLFTNQTIDSLIAIPLNSLTNKTVYKLKMNNIDGTIANNQIATFTIEYIPKEEYVSRSCGFKVIFNDVTFSADNTWIKDFTPSTLTTINNQNEVHVKIFH